jgi:methionyl aminopeptidase
MSIETEQEYEGLRAAGAVVARTLRAVARELKAGVSTLELDDVARYTFARYGARSAPQLDVAYPATICISVNDEAVHGIPGPRTIAEGDLVTIDVTAELDGFYADAAVTHAVGPVPAPVERLKRCAEAAFHKGAAQARSGVPLWKVGQEIDREVRRRGFRVLKELCGHGIGRAIHEEPSVPNYRAPYARERLTENLVITIEPIVCASTNRARLLRDGWTVASLDGGLTAHHEHTIVIRRGEPEVLTAA